MNNDILVEGIETNNLKDIDVRLIKGGINLILGPSGSGKSTLAYSTISQIGQHEYMSMFADDILEPTYKVRSFKNMLPAVPIKQTNYNNNTRSTIGSYFGVSNKINLLYSALLDLEEDFFQLTKEENVCECCHGVGFVNALDLNKIIDYDSTVRSIPFRCWNKYKDFYSELLCRYCADEGIDPEVQFRDLPAKAKEKLLYGESKVKYSIKYKKVGRLASRTTKYYGVMVERDLMPGHSISKAFYSYVECPKCRGMRYNKDHLSYHINGMSIGDFQTTEFGRLDPMLDYLSSNVTDVHMKFAVAKISGFVKKAVELKLGHLYFNRSIPTLSGGELQRLRLVQVFNTQLSNLLIVLDEPLAGLSKHERPIIQRNVEKLAKDNTIVIVDHGKSFLQKADAVICLGPIGGSEGGYIIDTKKYLAQQEKKIKFDAPKCGKLMHIGVNSEVYQYKGVDIRIAEERMNLITGISGVGKSTLLREYFPQVLNEYVYINQKALLGNKNSSVATAIDVANKIAMVFGRRFKKDKKLFSNLTGNEGCCKKCGGAGYIEFGDKESKIAMECHVCHGTGFNPEIENFKINDKSMFDVWNMTVSEAVVYFSDIDKKISDALHEAEMIKVGHLKLGQATRTLSGGENIRIKLLRSIHTTSKIIGIDEPFKGLNPSEKIAVGLFLDELRKSGKTIVVIDHSEDIESFFSYHIELDRKDGIILGKAV